MIIPGLIPAGAQQDVFKPERQTRTTAVAGVPYEPLSELPVDDDQQQQQQQSKQPQDETAPATLDHAETAANVVEADGTSLLPRKGLMVDIRA